MKASLIQLLLFFSLQQSFGQVSGKLLTADGKPIPFANVQLLKSTDTAFVKAGLTNEQGEYHIENVPPGNYLLRFSSIGYQTLESKGFELAAMRQAIDLGTLRLQKDNRLLTDVIIRAAKPMYQQQPGGIVVNVESSLLTRGSSALEVLERSPGVIIDHHNNSISLNGKSGVTVMLNGKLLHLSMQQLVALLNSMSANDIEKIELLTTPPAKYDAEGTAGIINIVLKKSKKEGTHGTVSLTAGYGLGEKGNAGVNLDHYTGKVDLHGAYSFSHDRNYNDLFAEGTEIVPILGGQTSFTYQGKSKAINNSHDATMGVEVKINPNFTIGGSVNYNNSMSSGNSFNQALYTLQPDSLLFFSGNIHGTNHWQNSISSLSVEKKFREGEQLNVDVDYLYYHNNNPSGVSSSFLSKNGNEAGAGDSVFPARQAGFANTVIKVAVAKMDYTRQLGKKIKLEAGVKGTYTRSTSASGIESLLDGAWVISQGTSNNINMNEDIEALYTSLNTRFSESVYLVTGLRYEYAHTDIEDAGTGKSMANRKLGVFFPNIFLSKKVNDHTDLQLSYSKRISRPSYNDLASFVTYNDPISVFSGNPLLKPTISNTVKLGYSYRGYLFSLLFSHDDYPIAEGQITSNPANNLVYISPQNLRYFDNLALQVSLPFNIKNWWTMNYGFVGGWRQYKVDYTPQSFIKSCFSYSLSFNETFKLPGQFSMEISGWYNSVSYYASARIYAYGALNAGVKKELKNNGGSFQLSATDILRSSHGGVDIGALTKDAFSTNGHVQWYPESSRFPILKLTYFRSLGHSQPTSKKDKGSQEETDRVRR